jgi:hypothetical protein
MAPREKSPQLDQRFERICSRKKKALRFIDEDHCLERVLVCLTPETGDAVLFEKAQEVEVGN